jgi:hypothetical protein
MVLLLEFSGQLDSIHMCTNMYECCHHIETRTLFVMPCESGVNRKSGASGNETIRLGTSSRSTPFVFLVEDSTSSKYYIELHITVSDEKNYNLHVRFRLISPQCVAVQYSEGKSCSTRLQRSGLARVMV